MNQKSLETFHEFLKSLAALLGNMKKIHNPTFEEENVTVLLFFIHSF
jgi:hypothetical protein